MILVKKLSDNSKGYIDTYYQIIEQMADQMRSVEASQSISQMFINQMVPHHEAGIKMSENILNYTTDTDVEALAKTTIADQSQHIILMETMLTTCMNCENTARDVSLYQRQFNNILENMLRRMNNIQMGNNLNVNYLNGMIVSHEGAISIAKNVLQFDICPELKEMAEHIVTSHTKHLEQTRMLLRKLS